MNSPQPQHVIATVPARLAVSTKRRTLPPSVRTVQHRRVAEISVEWQQFGTKARFWEMAGIARGATRDWGYALAGQMAAAGEQLGLAVTASLEVALWREFRKRHQMEPEHEMAMRAMTETQSYFIMGAGHALANVAVRALGFRTDLRALLQQGFTRSGRRPTFRPFSDEIQDWISLNQLATKRLRAAARAAGSDAIVGLIEPVCRFGGSSIWKTLTARRGEHFHRWRPQSHGVAGVSRRSPWMVEGSTATLSGGNPEYADANELAEETSQLATAAMFELSEAMDSFANAWATASGPLGGPQFRTQRHQ